MNSLNRGGDRSRSPKKNGAGSAGGFPLGIDNSILNQEEIDKLL